MTMPESVLAALKERAERTVGSECVALVLNALVDAWNAGYEHGFEGGSEWNRDYGT